jgi:hypothetical protein
MYGRDCHVGCLSGSLLRHVDGLKGSILLMGESLSGSLLRHGDGLRGSLSMVCSVNKDAYIRFKDGFITWYGTDNNDGVIKYNTLIASGDWSLEEVEIEELL